MKPRLLAAFERIADGRLTSELQEKLADCAIEIMEDHIKTAQLAALEKAKQLVVSGTTKIIELDNGEPKPK